MKRKSSIVILSLFTLVLSLLFFCVYHTQADSPIKVGLVIRHGNDALLTRCVTLDGPNVTGLDVLQAVNNLHLVIDYSTGPGAAVCSIDNEGCPSSNCFCECGNGGTCAYWAYYYLVDGKWQYSNLGSSNRQISHGDVEGWSWGSGSFGSSGTQPRVLTFDQICAPPSAATDTPVPTHTPTATPTPTQTPELTETPSTTHTSIAQKRFWSDAEQVRAGTCTTLRWEVTAAQTVVFMGESVTANGSRSVCPCSATSYNLDVTYADGTSEVLSLTLEVDGTCDNIVPALVMTPEPTYTSVADVVQPVPQPTTYLTLVPVSTPTAMATPPSQPSPTPETGLIAPQQELTSPTTTPPPVSNTASLPRYEVEQPVSSKTANWGGYLVFGILLMGLGVGYLVVQKYGFE
ncbi:MAG: hypothetical protein JW981_04195 [Anaerolineae bacterium]|nr:hypothetical protein [Anaerolineae bacterium]